MNNPEPFSTHYSMSFSLVHEIRDPLNRRAAELGLSRSKYVQKLIERDLANVGMIDEEAWYAKMTIAPPRVKRERAKQKKQPMKRARGKAAGKKETLSP